MNSFTYIKSEEMFIKNLLGTWGIRIYMVLQILNIVALEFKLDMKDLEQS